MRFSRGTVSSPSAQAMAFASLGAAEMLNYRELHRKGLRMPEWLLTVETRNDHLSVVSRQGRSCGEAAPLPASDQRPVGVAALADAPNPRSR